MFEDKTSRALGAAFLAFVAVWSAYFSVSELGASIHNDMAEAYVWGREFQLGYNQHPPFWAWVCGAWFSVFPRAGWSFAILSSLNAGLGLLGAWMLIGRFARGEERIAATALLLLTPFYTFLSYKYNANSIFLSIWPWTLLFFIRAIDDGKRLDALLFGIGMGCALLSKYYAGVLGATCFLAALQHPERARYFRSASPYISVAVAALLLAPHGIWLIESGAPPLRYLGRVSGRGFETTLFYAVSALLGSLAQNGLALAFVAFAAFTAPAVDEKGSRRRLLAILVLAPPLLSILAALALRTKLSANMLIGVFPLAPLLMIEAFSARGMPRLAYLAPRMGIAIALAVLALSPAIALGKAWFSRVSEDVEPRKEVAQAATKLWREATGKPLAFVAGSFRYDNAIAFYSEDAPRPFVRFDYFANRWVTPEKLARDGLLTVCVKGDAECAASTTALAGENAKRTELTLSHRFWGHEAKPVTFEVTIIPPKGG